MNHASIYSIDYEKFKKHEEYSQNSFFCNNAKLKRFSESKNYISTEEMRKNLKLDEAKIKYDAKMKLWENKIIEPSAYDNMQMIELRKKDLINGNKNLIKGIYGNTNTSIYQESFKGQNEKFKINFTNNIYDSKYLSGVKGKIPDPSIMNIISKNNDINACLADKVKKIII